MLELSVRQELINTARAMNTLGLNQGMSGNLSSRYDDKMLITPSGMSYDHCRAGDMVLMNMDGGVEGQGRPSSEWQLHLDIYVGRKEAGAVLHAHSPWCTTLACMDREIPAFHYMVAMAGGDSIRCAPYAIFGSRELSCHVQRALHERCACLMSHHGMICFADTPAHALDLAVEVENLARVFCQVLQIGEPSLLDKAQMHKVLLKFADYRSSS